MPTAARVATIESLYALYFNRVGEYAGVNYWDAQGTDDAVANGIAAATGAAGLGLTGDAYIEAIYAVVGRSETSSPVTLISGEVTYWSGQLTGTNNGAIGLLMLKAFQGGQNGGSGYTDPTAISNITAGMLTFNNKVQTGIMAYNIAGSGLTTTTATYGSIDTTYASVTYMLGTTMSLTLPSITPPALTGQSSPSTLMLLGGSVVWGNGLQTDGFGAGNSQDYASAIQAKLNDSSHLNLPSSDWTARCVHSDDYNVIPFNGANTVPGMGQGTDDGAVETPSYPNMHTAKPKLNRNSTTGKIVSVKSGIFANCGVSGNNWAEGSIELATAGTDNVVFTAYNAQYLDIGLIGNGSVDIYSTAPGTWPITVSNTSTTAITVTAHNLNITGGASGPYNFSIWLHAGSSPVQVAVLNPRATDDSHRVSVQTCARNSYALEDYMGTDASGTGAATADLIKQSLVSTGGTSTFVLIDTYNSMVQPRSLYPDAPGEYAAKLETMARTFQSAGNVILTMPIGTLSTATYQPLPGYMFQNFEDAIQVSALKLRTEATGYSFMSFMFTSPAWASTSTFYYPDEIHPTAATGVPAIVTKYESNLGL
jgi:hypothetical protein